MVRTQQQKPVRRDRSSEVSRIGQDLDIGLDIEEIRITKRSIFRRLSKQKCEEAAFAALIEKRNIGETKVNTLNMEAA